MADDPGSLYRDRRLLDGYPDLGERSLEWYQARVAARPDDEPRVKSVLSYLERLVDLGAGKRFLVIGCGPTPHPIRILREQGFDVVGVEPDPLFVAAAREDLGDENAVLIGTAEDLPNADESQDVVVLESVLEHVDSVERSLAEIHRVLAPGGIAYITTTNRLQVGGHDAEFNVRLYPWLPAIVKESYVFRHLHYDPTLANFTERPAVHWFTFAELCELGRAAGFYQFYSHLDLRPAEPSGFSGSARARRLKARTLTHVQRNPWLRALALSQRGGLIFMVKRR